eukprot:1818859-Prymnesium_polylepis.1
MEDTVLHLDRCTTRFVHPGFVIHIGTKMFALTRTNRSTSKTWAGAQGPPNLGGAAGWVGGVKSRVVACCTGGMHT